MARVSDEIKVIRAKRLNIVIQETGVLRKELARICGVTPAYVSSMAPKNPDGVDPKDIAAVSRTSARKINERFPDYSVEWLLGEDDYPNELVRKIEERIDRKHEQDQLDLVFGLLAELYGYTFTATTVMEPDGKPLDSGWQKQKVDTALIIKKDGKTVTVPRGVIHELQREIGDYCDFKLSRLFKG